MSEKVNAKLVSLANAFPGNVNAKPDFVTSDKAFAKAFEIYKTGYLANEFTGLPVAEDSDDQVRRGSPEDARRRAVSGTSRSKRSKGLDGEILNGLFPVRYLPPGGLTSGRPPVNNGSAIEMDLFPKRTFLLKAYPKGGNMTRQKRSHHRLKRAVAPYLYLSPSLLIIGLLMLLPMVTVIWLFVPEQRGARRDPTFAGLKHYQAIFADPVFWASLWQRLYFTCMSVVFHMTIGMVFALMLNSDRINPTLRNILRVLDILPWLFTAVIIAVIWRLLLSRTVS